MELDMAEIQVLYATKTQHSRKLAEAIASELGVQASEIGSSPQPLTADLLFLAGGIYGGKGNPALLDFASKLDAGRIGRVVLVTSSLSIQLRSQVELRDLLASRGIPVAGEITSTGSLLFIKAGHPNARDLAEAARAAKEYAAQGK